MDPGFLVNADPEELLGLVDAASGPVGRLVGAVYRRPVAVTGSGDGTVRVWDLTTGRPSGPELVFPAEVYAVAVTLDGRLVVGFGHEVAVLARC